MSKKKKNTINSKTTQDVKQTVATTLSQQNNNSNSYDTITNKIFSHDNIESILSTLKTDHIKFVTEYEQIKHYMEINGISPGHWIPLFEGIKNNTLQAAEILKFCHMSGNHFPLLDQLEKSYKDIVDSVIGYYYFSVSIQQSATAHNVNKLITDLQDDFSTFRKILCDEIEFASEKEKQDFLNHSKQHNIEANRILQMVTNTVVHEEECHIVLRELYNDKIVPIVNDYNQLVLLESNIATTNEIHNEIHDLIAEMEPTNHSDIPVEDLSITRDESSTINDLLNGRSVEEFLRDVD